MLFSFNLKDKIVTKTRRHKLKKCGTTGSIRSNKRRNVLVLMSFSFHLSPKDCATNLNGNFCSENILLEYL